MPDLWAESPSRQRLPVAAPDTLPFNDLDRKIIAALQINGRATWHKVASAVGASESTVSRRANRLLSQGYLRIVGVADPLRCGLGFPVLLQLECAVGAVASVARTLAQRPDVRFVALLTGSYDLILEIIVPSRAHLAMLLVHQLNAIPGITSTTTESVLRNFKTSYDWSRQVLGSDTAALEPSKPADTGQDAEPPALDATDMQLLQLLAGDGRLSVAELADQAGVSESVVRRRVDALKAAGALRFATLVDPRLMGYECEFVLWLNIDLSRLEQVATALGERPEIRYLSATAGYSDLVAEVILPDLDSLYRFNTEVLGSLPGIRRSEIGLELQTVKRVYLTSATPVLEVPHTL